VVNTYPLYSYWIDHRTGDYEVVRWDSPLKHEVVQTNIKTRDKAVEATETWQKRDADKTT